MSNNKGMDKYIVKFRNVYQDDYQEYFLELKENISCYAKSNYYNEVENAIKNREIVLEDGEYTFDLFRHNSGKLIEGGGHFKIKDGIFIGI